MKVIFFSPAAELWTQSFPEALVGSLLKNSDVSVLQVRCQGILAPLCPAGFNAGFNEFTSKAEYQKLCESCIQKRDLIDKKFKFESILLDDYIRVEDEIVIDNIIKQARTLLSNNVKSIDTMNVLSIEGIQVGSTALYELLLRHKINRIELLGSIKEEYLISLRMASLVALASNRILLDKKPDCVSVHNSLYVPHRVFCIAAKNAAIPQYFIHAGTNLSRQLGTLMIGKDFTWAYLRNLVNIFPNYKNIPLKKFVIDDIANHMMTLIKAQNIFVYSVAKSAEYIDIREQFKAERSQKILLACTSSYDERFAVESVGASKPVKTLFKNTIDWIRYLISHAKEHPERFIIIRVHPREFPNRRDNVQSIHSMELAELMEGLPSNVAFNWPDEGISLYDLAQEASVVLNAWSSIGKELALLGIPIVSYSEKLLLYPGELNFIGETLETYDLAISAAIENGYSMDLITKAFRWYGLEFSRSLVDLRKSYFPDKANAGNKVVRRVKNYLMRYTTLFNEKVDILRVATMKEAQSVVYEIYSKNLISSELALQQDKYVGNSVEEAAAIRQTLKKIGSYLFSPNPIDKPSKLQQFFLKNNLLG